MNILTKLRQLNDLTNNQKALVDYILEKPQDFLVLKPKEIAKAAYVSVSTIYRLLDRIDLNGVNELKIEIASCLEDRSTVVDNDYPILPTDSNYEVAKNLRQLYNQTIEDSFLLNDFEILEKVVDLLIEAQHIDVYSSSANLYFAKNFKFQMEEIGVYINVPSEDYMQRLLATNSDNGHVAIVVSYGGRGSTTRDVVSILKENNIKIILVSSYLQNPLEKEATYTIYMSSLENHYNKISSFSTRLTLLYIFDVIYSIYFKRNYDKNLDYKLINYQKMNKNLR